MPKVHHVKARKDYPNQGIKKGDMYYNWKIKTGPASGIQYRSLTPPRPSQLTNSDYAGRYLSFSEQAYTFEDSDDAESQISTLAEEIRELGNEQREKFDNMPEGLQQGDTGQLLEQRADNCDSIADEVEGIDTSWDEPEKEDDESEEDFETRLTESREQRMLEIAEELTSVLDGSDWG